MKQLSTLEKSVTTTTEDVKIVGEGLSIKQAGAVALTANQITDLAKITVVEYRASTLSAKILDVINRDNLQSWLYEIMDNAKDHAEGVGAVNLVMTRLQTRRSRLLKDLKVLACDSESHILKLPNRWSITNDRKPSLQTELRGVTDPIAVEVKTQQAAYQVRLAAEQMAILNANKEEQVLQSDLVETKEEQVLQSDLVETKEEQVLQSDLVEKRIDKPDFQAIFATFDAMDAATQEYLIDELINRSKSELAKKAA
jgi:hypothetical protein